MRLAMSALIVLGMVGGASAAEAPASGWTQGAWDTWIRMGVGMHVVLGKVGIGDMAGQPEAAPSQPLVMHAIARSPDGALVRKAIMTNGERIRPTQAVIAPPIQSPPYIMPRLPGFGSMSRVDTTLLGLNARDLASSALSTGLAVGVAGYTCGTLGASLGPVVAGAAYFGCSWAGSYIADKGLRAAYGGLGIVPDEMALGVGQMAGTVVGGWHAAHGITNAATRQMLKGYGAVTSPTFRQALPGMARQFKSLAAQRMAVGVAASYLGFGGEAVAGEPTRTMVIPAPNEAPGAQAGTKTAN